MTDRLDRGASACNVNKCMILKISLARHEPVYTSTLRRRAAIVFSVWVPV